MSLALVEAQFIQFLKKEGLPIMKAVLNTHPYSIHYTRRQEFTYTKIVTRIVPFLSCAPPLEAEQMIISISSDQSFLQRGWKL